MISCDQLRSAVSLLYLSAAGRVFAEARAGSAGRRVGRVERLYRLEGVRVR